MYVLVCPYCMTPKSDELGCCGESRAHFEKAYEIDGVLYLEDEVPHA